MLSIIFGIYFNSLAIVDHVRHLCLAFFEIVRTGARPLVFLYANRIEKTALPPESLVLDLDDYWRSLMTGDQPPPRSKLDPSAIGPTLLPWLFMADVVRDGETFDYRYRLAGTKNVQLVGREPTGKMASSIFKAEDRAFILETFHVTVNEARPTYWRAAVPHERHRYVDVFRGLFPLSTDGSNVDILLGAAVPDRPSTEL